MIAISDFLMSRQKKKGSESLARGKDGIDDEDAKPRAEIVLRIEYAHCLGRSKKQIAFELSKHE